MSRLLWLALIGVLAGPATAQTNRVSAAETTWLGELRITLPDRLGPMDAQPHSSRASLPPELLPTPSARARTEIERLVAEARGLSASNQVLRAGRLLWEAARENPHEAQVVEALAAHYANTKDAERAAEFYAALSETHPSRPDFLFRLAQTLDQAGRVGESAEVYCKLGERLFALGRLEPAAPAYRRALDRNPDLVAAWRGLSQVQASSPETAPLLQTLENLKRRMPPADFAAWLEQKAFDGHRKGEGFKKLLDPSPR